MALSPMKLSEGLLNTGQETFQIAGSAGVLPINLDGVDMDIGNYEIIGIKGVTSGYYVTPYINVNGKWRGFAAAVGTNTPASIGTSIAVDIYYRKL